MKSHLNYYKKLNTAVTVNVKDLSKNKLIDQRFNFYFQNKIIPTDLSNKSIIEFCAGTGYNAFYLVSECKIKDICLLEKNPSSLKSLKNNLRKFKNVRIRDIDIFKYKPQKKYDFVICENAIDGFDNASLIFKKILRSTKKNGQVLLTFGDDFGIFSTKLRYLYALMIVEQNNIKNFNEKKNFLSKIFKKDLLYLSKNSRKTEKWVLDNILNYEWIIKKKYFGYKEICKSIKNNFLIKSFTPQFQSKNYWYKQIDKKNINKDILFSHIQNKINLLNFETTFDKKINLNKLIERFNENISKLSFDKKINLKTLNSICDIINNISLKLKKLRPNNQISLALNEYSQIINKFKKNKPLPKTTKEFYKFFGRYNQTITLVRIK